MLDLPHGLWVLLGHQRETLRLIEEPEQGFRSDPLQRSTGAAGKITFGASCGGPGATELGCAWVLFEPDYGTGFRLVVASGRVGWGL